MLYMGRFDTEIEIILQTNLQECLRYYQLIGPDEDESSLLEYTNKLTRKHIEEKVQYFPNTQRGIDFWIIT